jgi:hypothetical protein
MSEPITWTNETRKLSELVPWERNPRQIREDEAQRLAESLDEFGQVDIIAIGPGGEIYNGHQRLNVWAGEHGPDLEVAVRVASRELTEKEREKLTILLHKGTIGEFDFDLLANDFELDDLLEWGFSESDFQLDWGDDGDVSEDEPDLTRHDVPDALWPTDNEWGVPLLDATLQASAVELPVSLWGAVQRKARMKGTWLFYCDDYRFEALWADPSDVVNTQCRAVVEPNFTVGPQTPKAVALWQVYRKRWLARWWQSFGIKTLVDVNIDMATFADIALLGVPEGWKAYATRGYSDRMEFTIMEYEAAKAHAGCDPLFLLYGGGKACQELAKERGWVYISEHMDQKRGGVVDG